MGKEVGAGGVHLVLVLAAQFEDTRHIPELVLVLWQVELLVLDDDLVRDRRCLDLLVDSLAELLRSLGF